MSDPWDIAKGILAQVAPVLGTALGGPLGGIAARVITNAVLGKETDDQAVAAQAIAGATPDQLLALKKAEQEFALKLKELDVTLENIAADDRKSARQRQVDAKDKMPGLIAVAALAGFFGILAAMIFVELPESSKQPLAIMLGALGALVGSIGNYYFGSSRGSAQKGDVLEKLVATMGAPRG